MNYFAHGRRFLENPYFLAGTAVPDWLNVVDRRAKARSRNASKLVEHHDSAIAAVAAGIVQHHFDDRWFHQTRAFVELSLQFTVQVRELLGQDQGFRPSFLGHILVELLLDSVLFEAQADQLDRYYRAIEQVDPQKVTSAVNSIATRPVPMLPVCISRFSQQRFLYDYSDDQSLLMRLNHVMKRVGLAELPPTLVELMPEARETVRQHQQELLEGESKIRAVDLLQGDQ